MILTVRAEFGGLAVSVVVEVSAATLEAVPLFQLEGPQIAHFQGFVAMQAASVPIGHALQSVHQTFDQAFRQAGSRAVLERAASASAAVCKNASVAPESCDV